MKKSRDVELKATKSVQGWMGGLNKGLSHRRPLFVFSVSHKVNANIF